MGLYIILGVILYIYLSYKIANKYYEKTQNYKKSLLVFIAIVTFLFWDLIAQKGIKTFYELTGLHEVKIYAYPQKDKNGKFESLGLGEVTNKHIYRINDKKEIGKFLSGIYNFKNTTNLNSLELQCSIEYYLTRYNQLIQFYYKNNKLKMKYLDKSKARYILKKEEPTFSLIDLFTLYHKIHYKIIDTKTDKILADSYEIEFENIIFSFIREDILFLRSGSGYRAFYITGIGGWQKLISIFDLKY